MQASTGRRNSLPLSLDSIRKVNDDNLVLPFKKIDNKVLLLLRMSEAEEGSGVEY